MLCTLTPPARRALRVLLASVPAWLCRVNAALSDVPHHGPAATRAPSARVPLGLRHALQGVGPRACDRGLPAHHRDQWPARPGAGGHRMALCHLRAPGPGRQPDDPGRVRLARAPCSL